MHYCRSLRFEDRPDYAYLRKMFRDLMVKQNLDYDYIFDWALVEPPKRPTPGQSQQRTLPSAILPVEDVLASLVVNPLDKSQTDAGDTSKEEPKKDAEGEGVPKSSEREGKSGFVKSDTANFGNEAEDAEKKKKVEGEEEEEEEEDEEEKEEKTDKDGKKEGKGDEAPKKSMMDSFKDSGKGRTWLR